MPTFTTNSLRWQIFTSVADALASAPELQGVTVRRNPRQPVKLNKGDHLVVIRWEPDSLVESNGVKEVRRFTLLVGSITNTAQADRDADAMHLVVGDLVRKQWPALSVFANKVKPREIEVVPDVENLLIEGALVASAWEIEYERRHSLSS